MFGAFESDH